MQTTHVLLEMLYGTALFSYISISASFFILSMWGAGSFVVNFTPVSAINTQVGPNTRSMVRCLNDRSTCWKVHCLIIARPGRCTGLRFISLNTFSFASKPSELVFLSNPLSIAPHIGANFVIHLSLICPYTGANFY